MNGISVAGADVVITVAAVAGETYQLQSATDLTAGDWSNVTGVAVTNFGGALSPGRYYRFAIVP